MFGGAGHTGVVRDRGWQPGSNPDHEVEQADELLSTGHPPPTWARAAAVAVVVVLGGYLVAHLLSRNSAHPTPVAAGAGSHSAQLAPPLFRAPGGPRMITPLAICGNGL